MPSRTPMRQARSQGGGNGSNCPPNSQSCTKNFHVNQTFDVQAKEIFQRKSPKCLRNLLHNLVEPDQITVVHQLSMINQTLCTGGGLNGRIFQVKPRIFVGWAKMVKFHFFNLKLSKQSFLLQI